MTILEVLALVIAFVVGSGLQRISGLGTGMVVAPSMSLLLGPVIGVSVSNAGAVLAAIVVLTAMRRDVDWRRFARIAPLLVLGSLVGAWVVRTAEAAVLDVVVGATVLLALVLGVVVGRVARVRSRAVGVLAAVVGGAMNTTAGVAGPAFTAYAVATRWDQRSFAATLQPIFLTVNGCSLLAKLGAGALPATLGVPGWVWPIVFASVLGGTVLGGVLGRHVSSLTGRRVAVGLAGGGASVALLHGIAALSV